MRKPAFKLTACFLGLCCITSVLQADEKPAEATKPIEPAAVTLGRPVDFERDIYPILDANCIACHNLAIAESKLNLEEIPDILKGGKRGPSVVAKEPDKSLLYLVAARATEPHMPPLPNKVEADALSPEQLGLLRQWILEGANMGSGGGQTAMQWQPLPPGTKSIYSLALSPWSDLVAAGRANQVSIYNVESGEEVTRLTDPNLAELKLNDSIMYPQGAAHRDFVHALEFSPDGSMIASAGYRVVKLWQHQAPRQQLAIKAPANVTATAVSADGQWLATATADNAVTVWGLGDGVLKSTLTGHSAGITGLAFSATGTLYSASADNTIRHWSVADSRQLAMTTTPAVAQSLALTPDGTRLATGHADNLIRVWDTAQLAGTETAMEPLKPVLELKGHEKPVTSLAAFGDSNQLASAGEDGTIRLWDLKQAKETRSIPHGAAVTAIAVRPDGQAIASSGADLATRIWGLDGKAIAEIKGDFVAQRQVAAATEAQTVAQQIAGVRDAAFKKAEKSVKERTETLAKAKEAHAAAEKAVTEAEAKAKETDAAAASAKEELAKKPEDAELKKKSEAADKAAAAQQDVLKKARDAVASAKRTVEISEKTLKSAEDSQAEAKALLDEANQASAARTAALTEAQAFEKEAAKPTRTLAFSTDGKTLATGGDGTSVDLWNGQTGKPIDRIVGVQTPVTHVTFRSAGSVITAGSSDSVTVWDVTPQWNLVAQLGPNPETPLDETTSVFGNRVLALGFSPDGKLLATGGGEPSRSGELMIWNLEKRAPIHAFENAHSDTVFGVEFSRDGKYLISGAADKFVKMFDVVTGEHIKSFEGHTHHVLDVSWKADGSQIASAGADNAIKIWNVATGEQSRTISNYSKQVTSVQYVGSGENILSCGGDRTVRYHKTSNGSNFRNFSGGTDFMYAAAGTGDESLVIAGGEDGVLRIWNGKDGKVQHAIAPPAPVATAESQANAAP